jgi:hypothetical protein
MDHATNVIDQPTTPPDRLTVHQANVVTAFTGILVGPVAAFHRYAETLLERPIFSHEFARRAVWDELREASRSEFLAMAAIEEPEPAR